MQNNETPNKGINPDPNAKNSNTFNTEGLRTPIRNTSSVPTERIASKPTRLQRFFSKKTFLALFLLAAILGLVTGLELSYQYGLTYDAQAVKQLADYKPSLVTQVFADDGKTIIGEFSLERRMPISYDEIPVKMRQAVMAIEDARFKSHWGIDPIGIARAGWRNFQAGATVEGGSTLTQQLAKMLFLSPEKSLTRKMKEALLALQIERQFTKQQIMEFYCNQIFLGGGSYGIEAGAQYYFGKSVKDLELEETALLAGLPKAPSAYSPTRDIKRAQTRRNLVLDNMAEEGFISRSEADIAKNKPIKLNVYSRIGNNNSPYGYCVEEVRQYLEESYGTRVAHTSGMKVYTTLNAEAQRHAMQAVRRGLHDYSRRHTNNEPVKFYNVIDNEIVKDLNNYKHADWDQEIKEKMYLQGLVMNVDEKTAQIKFGEYQAVLTSKDVAALKQSLNKILKKGDLAICNIKKVIPEKKELTISLEKLPQVAGAFVCIEAATGEIKAMVGGYDFNLSKFNNATQGNRQTGS
ncbi:MAG: penicillin-binding protein 1A, partial [bacterium]